MKKLLLITAFLRSEEIPGNTLAIHADDFSYQTDTGVLERIDAFMKVQ